MFTFSIILSSGKHVPMLSSRGKHVLCILGVNMFRVLLSSYGKHVPGRPGVKLSNMFHLLFPGYFRTCSGKAGKARKPPPRAARGEGKAGRPGRAGRAAAACQEGPPFEHVRTWKAGRPGRAAAALRGKARECMGKAGWRTGGKYAMGAYFHGYPGKCHPRSPLPLCRSQARMAYFRRGHASEKGHGSGTGKESCTMAHLPQSRMGPHSQGYEIANFGKVCVFLAHGASLAHSALLSHGSGLA
jgi:hypothetical protein